MDEPTSALTSREVDQLFALIERLTARGVAIVYITHRLDEVYRIGQRVTVLRDGRHVATQPLAETTVARAGPADGQSRYRRALSAQKGVGGYFTFCRRGARTCNSPTPCLLRVEGISRTRRARRYHFRLHAGEVLGIAGLLGAGRTELARILAGADRADAGRILIDGTPVTLRTPARRDPRAASACCPRIARPRVSWPALTVARNIALPHGRALARWGLLSPRAEATLAEPVMRDLRVKATPTQPCAS